MTRRPTPPTRAPRAARRRRGRWLRAASPTLGLAVAAAGCGGGTPAPPNLLLITIDTLRADRLACYGGDAEVGAAICALADRGTRFLWALAPAPQTAPSVASILTSRYPAHHGVSEFAVSFLDSRWVTVAERLREAGYTTAAFVSNPVLDESRNLNQGFDVYDVKMTRRERNRPGYEEREARATTGAALAWARVAAREPWFLWVHYQDPHGPYEPPDATPVREEPGQRPLPVLKDHSGLRGIPAYQALPGLFTPGAYQRRYLDEIRYLDRHVKRLVDGLDALGDPPAVLLTSDHGEAFGEDGYYFAHGQSVGLDQIRVPLLWRPPVGGRGSVQAAPVSLLDVAPTLLRAAGIEPPDGFQGRALPVEGVAAGPAEERRPIFAEHPLQAAVIVGRAYYARNRWPMEEGERHRDRVSGGFYQPIPERTARLGPEGPPAGYTPARGDGPERDLEPLLAEFIGSAKRREELRHEELPAEARERLRALGYLE